MRLGAFEIDSANLVWIGGHCLTHSENWGPHATRDEAIRQIIYYATACEGWFISACCGVADPFRLEKCDESDFFRTDPDAWLHVARCAHAGMPYHVAALQWLERNSPAEVSNILAHVENSR